jgi:squalene synthase HpnC
LNLENGYKEALNLAKSHYENFPVISLFVRKELRKHVAVIYQFARQADDLADEGDNSSLEKHEALTQYELKLVKAFKGKAESDFWLALANTISERKLSIDNFLNLLKAFKQDTIKSRYESFEDVLSYCKNSANPVGRLILELNEIYNVSALNHSDKICTALQLTNFYQDISVDIKKNRIYIPFKELKKYGVSENQFENNEINDKFRQLLKFQVERARSLFTEGRELLPYLHGRLKFQIRWTILGGEAILQKIESLNFNTLQYRPKLSKKDMLILALKAWKN